MFIGQRGMFLRARAGNARGKVRGAVSPHGLRVLALIPVIALLMFLNAPASSGSGPGDVVEAGTGRGWQLVFSDDFEREEIGDDWKFLDLRGAGVEGEGEWSIRGDGLEGFGGAVINRRFRGRHRVVVYASSENPCDLSPFIHASLRHGWRGGYLLQFGGHQNTRNEARRFGLEHIGYDTQHMIEPGRVHRIVGEFDGENVRLEVDGKEVHRYYETSPLIGEHHERVGIYIHNPGRIERVKVYLKPAE